MLVILQVSRFSLGTTCRFRFIDNVAINGVFLCPLFFTGLCFSEVCVVPYFDKSHKCKNCNVLFLQNVSVFQTGVYGYTVS